MNTPTEEDTFSFIYETSRHVAEEGDKCPHFTPAKDLEETKKTVNQTQFPLLHRILYTNAEILHKDFPKLQKECDAIILMLKNKESKTFIKTLRPSEHSEGNLYVLFPLKNTTLKQRITSALEKQLGEKVYLNHLNIDNDIASVEFKTDKGTFGLARFRFDEEKVERIE